MKTKKNKSLNFPVTIQKTDAEFSHCEIRKYLFQKGERVITAINMYTTNTEMTKLEATKEFLFSSKVEGLFTVSETE